jgi:hypothetical protein
VAPLPVNVTLPPAQTAAAVELAVTVGNAFTVTVVMSVLEHPLPSVPVTVYVSVATGVNGTPSVTPPVHAYELAPLPVSVTLLPAQTAAAVELAATVGNVCTVTVTEAVFEHPLPSVPVTVYESVETGVNGTPSVTPPVHAYKLAPLPVNVTLLPEQTADAVVFAFTVGNAFTVTVTVAVFEHPLPSVPVTVYVSVETGTNGTPSVTLPVHV